MKYNGWSNYATWCVNLHLSNDSGTYNYINDMAQEAIDESESDKHNTRKENAIQALSEKIKDMIEEENPLVNNVSMYSDMLQAIIDEADYYEIAETWIEDFEIPEEIDEKSP